MTPELWQTLITTVGVIAAGSWSYLASRRARLAKEVSEAVMSSISTTNGGSHLKDDLEEIKQVQRESAETLAVIKVALVRVEGAQAAQSRDIDRLDREDAKRATAAAEAHNRIHERIDDLGKRRGWLR